MHKTTGADGKWHVQALLTNTVNDTQARITVVNDRAYYATYNATTMKLLTSQCYSAYMPPLGDLTQVFGNAVFSPASDPPALVTTPECSSRDRFTLQWGPTNVLRSNTFVFCAVADSTFQVGFLRLCGVYCCTVACWSRTHGRHALSFHDRSAATTSSRTCTSTTRLLRRRTRCTCLFLPT